MLCSVLINVVPGDVFYMGRANGSSLYSVNPNGTVTIKVDTGFVPSEDKRDSVSDPGSGNAIVAQDYTSDSHHYKRLLQPWNVVGSRCIPSTLGLLGA